MCQHICLHVIVIRSYLDLQRVLRLVASGKRKRLPRWATEITRVMPPGFADAIRIGADDINNFLTGFECGCFMVVPLAHTGGGGGRGANAAAALSLVTICSDIVVQLSRKSKASGESWLGSGSQLELKRVTVQKPTNKA